MPLVEMRGIRKSFPGTEALAGVDFDIERGEVHVLCGENGAGKSTLMRVLAGLHPDYEGETVVDSEPIHVSTPRHADDLGIAFVQQELSLVPEMTVAENIFLGREPQARLRGFVDFRSMSRGAEELLGEFALRLPIHVPVRRLSAAARQLVEIAKGLSHRPRVLILDEPTSSLSHRETEELHDLIRRLRAAGTAIVYISHKLDEAFDVADRITVLRDGKLVATRPVAEWDPDAVVRSMVGRDVSKLYPKSSTPGAAPVLRVEGLSLRGSFEDVGFTVRRGEILGISGLIGAGRSEVAEAIFGLQPAEAGTIFVDGTPVSIRTPVDAIRWGIALVPEDRRLRGLIAILSVGRNISLPSLRTFSRLGWVQRRRERAQVTRVGRGVDLRVGSYAVEASALSGGNQQKAVIAKWLLRSPKILILDEPTHGIDVGAKAEVHALIDRLAAEGAAVVLISSELPEILGMSDRILVMRQGRVVAEFDRANANEEALMRAATAATTTSGLEA